MSTDWSAKPERSCASPTSAERLGSASATFAAVATMSSDTSVAMTLQLGKAAAIVAAGSPGPEAKSKITTPLVSSDDDASANSAQWASTAERI